MDKINVALYGGKSIFGGRETPLRAEIVQCDKYKKCSLYKNGCCLKITSMFSGTCKFGEKTAIKGYTSRAKKYFKFRDMYKEDAKFNSLHYPDACYVALIDDTVYLNLEFAVLDKNDIGEWFIDDAVLRSGAVWLPLNELTPDLLNMICSYRPHALMGGEIYSYQKEQIPNILIQLKKILPDIYKEFITKYDRFDIEPDYVDKYAYVNSIKDGTVIADSKGNRFIKNGNYLTSDSWSSCFLPFDARTCSIKIEITDTMVFKITDNSQVDDDTVFKQ